MVVGGERWKWEAMGKGLERGGWQENGCSGEPVLRMADCLAFGVRFEELVGGGRLMITALVVFDRILSYA